MADLTQPTTALAQLLSAKTSLDQYIAYLDQAMVELRVCDAADGLTQLTNAQTSLQTYQSQIQAAQTALQPYQNVLFSGSTPITPTNATLQQMENALTEFKICLEIDSTVTTGNGWDKPERVESAYAAVWNMIQTISSKMFGSDSLLGALQFVRTFHGTRLQLIQNTLASGALADTTIADRDLDGVAETSVISMFTGGTGSVVHTSANIVHEFGHVILDQNRGAMYLDWEAIRIYFNRNNLRDAIAVTEGWTPPDRRENRFDADKFDCSDPASLCQKLEIERIADMFLYWMYQNQAGYSFDVNNSSDPFVRDVAIAFQNFVKTEGAEWSRTVSGFTYDFTSQGMAHWITEGAASNISIECNVI